MDRLKEEFIRAIMMSLKIDNNPFIIGLIEKYVASINPNQYAHFMEALFGTQHAYLNGIDRVAKVAEQFKPIMFDDVEAKAKELILLCETLNTQIGNDAKRMGEDFIKLVEGLKLPTISDEDIAILNQVKPYQDHKQLIINIRGYQTSLEAIKAFKNAIKYLESYSGAIECNRVKGLLK